MQIEDRSSVLYEPDEKGTWPTGLIVHDTLTTVKKGKSSVMEIQVRQCMTLCCLNVRDKETEKLAKTIQHSRDQTRDSCHLKKSTTVVPNTRQVDLHDLTPEQQSIVKEILYEDRGAFSVDEHVMNIPRPLYPEVKYYLEDLLNRNFIRRSNSPTQIVWYV